MKNYIFVLAVYTVLFASCKEKTAPQYQQQPAAYKPAAMAQQPILSQPAKPNLKQRPDIINLLKKSADRIAFEVPADIHSSIAATGLSSAGNIVIYKTGAIVFYTTQVTGYDSVKHTPRKACHTWGMQLLQANKDIKINTAQRFETPITQFTAKGVINTPRYGEVVLTNVYDGIDLRLYSKENGNLEFDWLLQPYADPNKIRVQYKGQDKLTETASGGLAIGLRFGTIQCNIPEAYQPSGKYKRKVNAHFVTLNDEENIIGYAVNNRDPNLPLVIDPEIVWGTFIDANLSGATASSGFEGYLYSVDVDNNGDVYCGGFVDNFVDLNTGIAPYDNIRYGYNIPVTSWMIGVLYKVKADGSRILRIAHLISYSAINFIALSPSKDRVFAIGKLGISQSLPAGETDMYDKGTPSSMCGFMFVLDAAKLGNTADGGHIYYTTFFDYAPYCVLPLSNDSYVIGGQTFSQQGNDVTYITPASAPISTHPTATGPDVADGILQKFTGYNQLEWGTYIGCSLYYGAVSDIKLLSDGQIAFTGLGAFDPGRTQLVNATGHFNPDPTTQNGAIGVIPNHGSTSWSMFSLLGGGYTQFFSLDVKHNQPGTDELWFGGTSAGSGFPGVDGSFQEKDNGGCSLIIGHLPQTGKTAVADPLKSTYLGDKTGITFDGGIRLLNNGNQVLIIGAVAGSTGFPTIQSPFGGSFFQGTAPYGFAGGPDLILTVMDTSLAPGSLLYSTYIGSENDEYIRTINRRIPVLPDNESVIVWCSSHSTASFHPDIFAAGGFDHTPSSCYSNTADKHLLFKVRLNNIVGRDYGDMPASYGMAQHNVTTATYNGTVLKLALGAKLDIEGFYNETLPVPALGDDNTIEQNTVGDDEDAVNDAALPVVSSNTYTLNNVPVINTTGVDAMVYGYVDFNNDGDFDDAGEETVVLVPDGTATVNLNWSGYTYVSAASYVRLRIAPVASWTALTTQAARATGIVNEGEVEDHVILSVTLPVHFISFNVQLQADQSALLNWTIAADEAIKTHTVERSVDGRNWSTIGQLTQTNANGSYSFRDDLSQVAAATVYYRIRIQNVNDEVYYSQIKAVALAVARTRIRIAPNPFNDVLSVWFPSGIQEPTTIELLDIVGRKIKSWTKERVAGNYEAKLSGLGQLGKGVYVLWVHSANYSITQKVVKK